MTSEMMMMIETIFFSFIFLWLFDGYQGKMGPKDRSSKSKWEAVPGGLLWMTRVGLLAP